MRRKKPVVQVWITCDYCKDKTETFVSSYPDYLKFCRIQTPGKEPEKDCMTEYYKKNPTSPISPKKMTLKYSE